jgi:DNA mismatch repair ATPase MutS
MPKMVRQEEFLAMNQFSIYSLEIVKNYFAEKSGTLLNHINKAITPAGKRKVKEYILKPLRNKKLLLERFDTIEFLMSQDYESIKIILAKIADIERNLIRFMSHQNKENIVKIYNAFEAILMLKNNEIFQRKNLPVLIAKLKHSINKMEAIMRYIANIISCEENQIDDNLNNLIKLDLIIKAQNHAVLSGLIMQLNKMFDEFEKYKQVIINKMPNVAIKQKIMKYIFALKKMNLKQLTSNFLLFKFKKYTKKLLNSPQKN